MKRYKKTLLDKIFTPEEVPDIPTQVDNLMDDLLRMPFCGSVSIKIIYREEADFE